MRQIVKIHFGIMLLLLALSFSTNVHAVEHPSVSIEMNQVKLGKVKSSIGKQKISLNVDVKNKSGKKARKMVATYELKIKGITKSTKPVNVVSDGTISNEKNTDTLITNENADNGTNSEQETVSSIQEDIKYETVTTVQSETVKISVSSKKIGKRGKLTGVKKIKKKYDQIEIESIKLVQKKLYSGTGVLIYNAKKKKTKLAWGVKDKKAPVLSGMLKYNSFHGNDCYITVFSDRKNFKFKKYIFAKDNRDKKVKIKFDTSKVKWKRRGNYKVIVTAKDKAGNVAKSWLKIHVEPEGLLTEMADDILGRITNKSMSNVTKLRNIYYYVRRHLSYVDSNARTSWQNAAIHSVRYGYGNCFNYYALSRLLISRIGLPNAEITRYPAAYGNHHWWNLVYVNKGWYHFDNTPRLNGATYFLATDAQRGDVYNRSIYPKRATR